MTEEWTLALPEDVSERLAEMDDDRVQRVVSDALREALDLAETAEERRDALHSRRRGDGRDTEELADDFTEEPESDLEAKQAELREKITGPR